MSVADFRSSFGRVGIWSLELRFGDRAERIAAAAELDELGYGAIWIPGGIGGDVMGDVELLLNATRRAMIATGIINLWKHRPEDIGRWWQSLSDAHRARLMLGVGVSHSHLIGDAYAKPLTVTRDYLDQLARTGIPSDSLCLAALGPKMIELSRVRTAGAHPYLTTPEHTAQARALLGPGKLLAPEQGVILEQDATKARALARQALTHYQTLPNYVNNWLRLGLTEQDVITVSDRLVDALFAWGSVDAIVARINAHLNAGADHVCLQVITGAGVDVAKARPAWRELARAAL